MKYLNTCLRRQITPRKLCGTSPVFASLALKNVTYHLNRTYHSGRTRKKGASINEQNMVDRNPRHSGAYRSIHRDRALVGKLLSGMDNPGPLPWSRCT